MAPAPQYFVGIDFGGTNIKVGVVDLSGNISGVRHTAIGKNRSVEAVVVQMTETVSSVLLSVNLDTNSIIGIGIGSPGILDCKNGIILSASNFDGWVNVKICSVLSEKLGGVRCVLENDANAAAAAENWIGAGKAASSLVMMSMFPFLLK
jgi:glucokinase